MRNATILVIRLKGVATEAIKNIVLAGIGKLLVVDSDNVTEEDLGAGFFFRDEDVGKKVRLYHLCRALQVPLVSNVCLGKRAHCGHNRTVESLVNSYQIRLGISVSTGQASPLWRRTGWAVAGTSFGSLTFASNLFRRFKLERAIDLICSRSGRTMLFFSFSFSLHSFFAVQVCFDGDARC